MNLSPKQIVNELNKHIIGQDDAKKAVAIALRNRYRRSQLSKELRDEITPKNIIMKGPTGVGKTEIARRLAKLVKAPFVKVEATKYTEVGYVGKDVEGMVRDLVECAFRLVKDEKTAEVSAKATKIAEKKMVKILAEAKKADRGETPREIFEENLLQSLRKGTFDNTVIEADVPMLEIYGYSTDLRSMTGGSGVFEYEFARYEQAPSDVQEKEIAARAAAEA